MKLSNKSLGVILWISALGILILSYMNVFMSTDASYFSQYFVTSLPGILLLVGFALLIAVSVMIFSENTGTLAMILVLAYAAVSYSIASLFLAVLILCKRFASKLTLISKLWFVPAAVLAVLYLITMVRFFNIYSLTIVLIEVVVYLILGYWFVKENGVVNKKAQLKEDRATQQKAYFDDLLARGVITQEEHDAKIMKVEDELNG